MEGTLERIEGFLGIIIIIAIYFGIRFFFKRIANYTEVAGKNSNSLEELKEEIKKLNTKIESLENRINKDS
ncbi:hypothetical protein [Cloacibacterium rupense]|nr:hypothetical protein [Cloacibacterium rupense]